MVIQPPGIARHATETAVMSKRRRLGIIIHRQSDDRLRLRHKHMRMRQQFGAARHVSHLGGVSGINPGAIMFIITRKRRDRSNACDFKAKPLRRLFDLPYEIAHSYKLPERGGKRQKAKSQPAGLYAVDYFASALTVNAMKRRR